MSVEEKIKQIIKDQLGVSEEEVKGLIAKAMKDFAATLMAE